MLFTAAIAAFVITNVEAVGHEDVDGDLDATKVVGAVGPEDVGDGPDAIEVVGVSWGNMGEAA